MKNLCVAFFLAVQSLSVLVAQNDTVINQRYNKIQNSVSLDPAMDKLNRVKNNPDSGFVVVHFGDSHIQGDNLSGVVRNNF